MANRKPILGIDMDDVITDTLQRGLDWYERDFGRRHIKSELNGRYLREVIPEVHLDRVRNYFYTPGFFRDLEPLPGAVEGVKELQEYFDVFIVTAAQQFPQCLTEKNDWLDRFMPFIPWTHRVFCGHKYFLNAKYLIDDHAYNFEFFEGYPLLFTAPHNMGESRYERVNDWDEVLEFFSRDLSGVEPA